MHDAERPEVRREHRRLRGEEQPEHCTWERLARHLFTRELPDPDLIIRTSGEHRLSNFLLWQSAYTELVFLDAYWPDFDRGALEGAIAQYQRRERRYGGLSAVTSA